MQGRIGSMEDCDRRIPRVHPNNARARAKVPPTGTSGSCPTWLCRSQIGHLIENNRMVRVTQGGEDDLLSKLPRTARTHSSSELIGQWHPEAGTHGEEEAEGRTVS